MPRERLFAVDFKSLSGKATDYGNKRKVWILTLCQYTCCDGPGQSDSMFLSFRTYLLSDPYGHLYK